MSIILPALSYNSDTICTYTIKSISIPQQLNGAIKKINFGVSILGGALVLCVLAELEAEYRQTGEYYLQYYKEVVMMAWKQNRIFGISMQETSDMKSIPFLRNEGKKDKTSGLAGYFMYNSAIGARHYIFPCFIVSDSDACYESIGDVLEIIWVAKRIRGLGFGSYLMKQYMHRYVSDPMIGSLSFWKSVGFTESVNINKIINNNTYEYLIPKVATTLLNNI